MLAHVTAVLEKLPMHHGGGQEFIICGEVMPLPGELPKFWYNFAILSFEILFLVCLVVVHAE